MTQLTVNEVIDLIEKGIGQSLYRDFILENLDFFEGNEHIQNHLNHPLEYYFKEREKSLTGEEIVYGDYLLYDCCGHDGTEIIWTCESIDDIQKSITSDAGISNPFTTFNVAIVFGEIKEYEFVNNKFRWID